MSAARTHQPTRGPWPAHHRRHWQPALLHRDDQRQRRPSL